MIVNPPAKEIIEPYYDQPPFPRTALAFLAGHIRAHLEHVEVFVMDCKFDRLSFEQAVSSIKKIAPDIIGITAMTNEISSAGEIANKLKIELPSSITVIGGVHVTALPERTLREFDSFDYGITGEGEKSFLEFVEAIQFSKDINIPGVCYIEDNRFIDNKTSIMLPDQDSLMPAWDLFKSAKEYIIQSSRGCPFACNFCMNPGGRIVRPRTVQTTLDEIGWLIEYKGAKSIYFGDEIFTVNRDRAYKICEGLIERGYHKKISWWCQTHVNTIDDRLVKIMKDSNCSTVGLGIETGDEATLKVMGKGTSQTKILKAIQIMKKHKLAYDSFFILGQPNETLKSLNETVKFAIKINPDIPIFGLMVPYPGTEVWNMIEKNEGGYKLLSTDWDSYNKQIGNALELKNISRKQLERIQFFAYIKVFLYNYRFFDLIKFCVKYRTEGFVSITKIFTNFFNPLKN